MWITVKDDDKKILLSKGGCPANNTKCMYIVDGKCACCYPELAYIDGKLCCGSMR